MLWEVGDFRFDAVRLSTKNTSAVGGYAQVHSVVVCYNLHHLLHSQLDFWFSLQDQVDSAKTSSLCLSVKPSRSIIGSTCGLASFTSVQQLNASIFHWVADCNADRTVMTRRHIELLLHASKYSTSKYSTVPAEV